MRRAVISDTSCLILLHNIEAIDVLRQLYTEIIVTTVVSKEFGYTLPAWITIRDPLDEVNFKLLQETLDVGEASAIALAVELKDSLLIIDEKDGRDIAKGFGVEIVGTLGLLLRAKKAGLVDAIKPFIERIKATNFRVSDTLIQIILEEAGEGV